MGFPGILDLHKNSSEDIARPAFFLDLNIDQIIERICREWGEKIETYFYFPTDRESEDYRRAVYCDIKRADLFDALCSYRRKMTDTLKYSEHRAEGTLSLQKAVWAIYEAESYYDALECLFNALNSADSSGLLRSEGLCGLLCLLREYMAEPELLAIHREGSALLKQLNALRVRMTYESDRVAVAAVDVENNASEESGTSDGKDTLNCTGTEPGFSKTTGSPFYEGFLNFFYNDNPKTLVTPFDDTVDLTKLERSVLSIFIKRRPDFFSAVETFEKAHRDFVREEYVTLSQELSFYLSFRRFEIRLEGLGLVFSSPSVDEDRPIGAAGLYDLALACSMLDTLNPGNNRVVSNDFYYRDNEQFFVLTGPNQGGKTTFARSLGQLVYFTKMGLDVPAASANLHYFEDILTHFSVEESVETGRGKLKEELIRLAPMMEAKYDRSFVVINELFTTAANYDAIIMGTNVLQHFIKQACTGIYVTHLHELCEAAEAVTGICALLDENGKQSFKISRDNIDYVECAINQVNKHRLGYEQLKNRLDRLSN